MANMNSILPILRHTKEDPYLIYTIRYTQIALNKIRKKKKSTRKNALKFAICSIISYYYNLKLLFSLYFFLKRDKI